MFSFRLVPDVCIFLCCLPDENVFPHAMLSTGNWGSPAPPEPRVQSVSSSGASWDGFLRNSNSGCSPPARATQNLQWLLAYPDESTMAQGTGKAIGWSHNQVIHNIHLKFICLT